MANMQQLFWHEYRIYSGKGRTSSWLRKDEIAELLILAKNEQNKTEQMQKMLRDECHLLF